jgi:ATP-dependent protease ClpP protease subunit
MYNYVIQKELILKKELSDKTKKEVMNSEYHTMFVIDIPEKKEKVVIEQKGKQAQKDVYKITPAHKKYRVFVDSFMEFERGLHEMFNVLWNAEDDDELELRINSYGGLVKEGQNFYNLINNKFKGRTTTILDSAGYSMGALAFCMGDKRVVMPQSDLMFHDYSGGSRGKGGEMEAQVKHTAKHLRNFFRDVTVESKFLSKKEFKQMIVGQDYWMEPKELCERNIATHIMINGKEITSKEYLKSLKKK